MFSRLSSVIRIFYPVLAIFWPGISRAGGMGFQIAPWEHPWEHPNVGTQISLTIAAGSAKINGLIPGQGHCTKGSKAGEGRTCVVRMASAGAVDGAL